MERFINLLIIDSNKRNVDGLKAILNGGGNNVIPCYNVEDAISEFDRREIGIVFINIDAKNVHGFEFLQKLKDHPNSANTYKIVYSESSASGSKLVRGLKEGAIDFITTPFNPNLVKAKTEVFKTLYFKERRIAQLLSNILPETVLSDLNTYGKFSPKRIEEGVVLFTDFVGFSKKASFTQPIDLLKQLEEYFTKFDEIVERYDLEKIKTIGDSYMALAGVTEGNHKPSARACLAALEMRDYLINKKQLAQAMGQDFWEIRIGIHSGPLVAGIIGTKKISFDIWGDTVNIASRAEHHSEPGGITITDRVAGHVLPYFELEHRGEITVKHGTKVDMYFLNKLKNEYCLYGEGKIANPTLRKACGLIEMDFEHARRSILNILKSSLPDDLVYHDIKHTLNVEKSADRFAHLEGITGEDLILLKTAVLFHDAGFILKNDDNEEIAVQIMRQNLPKFGYSEDQIDKIARIIRSTKSATEPESLLEMIMCDADHDYLGRADYYAIANRLRKEMATQGQEMSDEEWLNFQLIYLRDRHVFYTQTAQNIRLPGKMMRINEIKKKLEAYKVSE